MEVEQKMDHWMEKIRKTESLLWYDSDGVLSLLCTNYKELQLAFWSTKLKTMMKFQSIYQ